MAEKKPLTTRLSVPYEKALDMTKAALGQRASVSSPRSM